MGMAKRKLTDGHTLAAIDPNIQQVRILKSEAG